VEGATLADMAERIYRLTVEGEFGHNLQPAFPGMELSRSDGNTALAGTATRPSSKVCYGPGAMLAIAAVRPGAGRVGGDVPVRGAASGDGWCAFRDRGW
jgi:hypothetical protein